MGARLLKYLASFIDIGSVVSLCWVHVSDVNILKLGYN